jgi:hypothetical protein
MKKHLVKAFLAITMLGVGLFATPAVMAIDPFCTDKANMGSVAWEAAGCNETATDQVGSSVSNIIKIAIGVLGLVAVVVIIVGGVSYMTAAGDPSKLKKAKDTILYAVIGLIIAALSFAITDFVIALLK